MQQPDAYSRVLTLRTGHLLLLLKPAGASLGRVYGVPEGGKRVNRSLCVALTPEQLLHCAERMKQCNALQLELLLGDLSLVEEEEVEEVDMVNGRFSNILVDHLLKYMYMSVLGVHESSMKLWVLVNRQDFSLLAQRDTFLFYCYWIKKTSKTHRPMVRQKPNLCNR